MNYRKNYKIISIFEKKFIFFPTSLCFFEVNDLIISILDHSDINNSFNEEIKNVIKQFEPFLNIEINKSNYFMQEQDNNIELQGVQINTINGCNLKCRYCFAGDGTHNKKNVLTIEDAKIAIDFLFNNSGNNKELVVTIIGGEPLLNIQTFNYILKYAKEESKKLAKKIKFITTTNGTLMNDEILANLKKYNVVTMLSLDSYKEEVHNHLRPTKTEKDSSYKIIMKNAWNGMVSLNKKGAVHCTITPKNLDIYNTAKKFYENGFYNIHFEQVVSEKKEMQFSEEDIGRIMDEYTKLAQYIMKLVSGDKYINCYPLLNNIGKLHKRQPVLKRCGALNNMFAISPDLKIYPCDFLMWDKYVVGTVANGLDLNRIDELKNVMHENNKCNACWGKNLCGKACLSEILNKESNRNSAAICRIKLHNFKLKLFIYYYIMKNNPKYINNFLGVD